MHTKKKGKSKSRKPTQDQVKVAEAKKEQIEKVIENYAKQGMSPALIGERLKREHNVPYIKHTLGKRLTKILEEKGMAPSLPEDLMNLMKKAVNLHNHLNSNARDIHNRTQLQRIESKIWRMTRYYINRGVLPAGWRYDPKTAELLIKGTA